MTAPDLSGRIDLTHGAGGRAMARLIADIFHRHLGNPALDRGDDQAVVAIPADLAGRRLVMSTDGHVVSPLFFPGGDIGALAVHGTVNDVALAGARPLWLTAAFILEEGLPLADLDRIVASMARAATEAGVAVVTGDTKVVERGKGDGVFIATTGVGVALDDVERTGAACRPGDRVLLSGPIGDHGVAIASLRQGLGFETEVTSDTAALHGLIADMVTAVPDIRCLRDPTRGGLAATLNELAQQSGVGMILEESAIPVRPAVRAACELLGLDPLDLANEGRLIAVCPPERAEALCAAMRAHPLAPDAAVIGTVVADDHHFVQLDTAFGGRRVVTWLTGEPLPRIC